MINTLCNHSASLVEAQLAYLITRLLQEPLAILSPAICVAALVGCVSAALQLAGPLLGVLRAVATLPSPYQLGASRVLA